MSVAPSEVKIVTFGCRLNAYESEVMRAQARAAGLENAVIVNTCAVTAEAERQARQAIRRARRQRPEARIIVTGCAAQIDPEKYAAMDEVDRVVGNEDQTLTIYWQTPNRPRSRPTLSTNFWSSSATVKKRDRFKYASQQVMEMSQQVKSSQ